MKTACLITQISLPENVYEPMNLLNQKRYDPLAECAVNSFKKFHPDVDLIYVNDETFLDYYEEYFERYDIINHVGIVRFMLASEIMKKGNYDKMIILGCDTVTCSRLDEFLDDNQSSVIATLNYPVVEETEYWKSEVFRYDDLGQTYFDVLNINADVVCFNSLDALDKVIDLSVNHFSHYGEQGALNELALVDRSFSVEVPEFPYYNSEVVYNARSKGVVGTNMIVEGKLAKHGPRDGEEAPTRRFYVKDGKLFTEDHKQIKVWHYVEGLGGRPDDEFEKILTDFKTNWFNEETKKFFKEECDCSNFFA
jgi:hypothetical protein